eukprot:16069215-Heterocapsa_arctica.AAC.1
MAFDKANLDVIGVQEGRVQDDQQKSGIIYEQFTAGAASAGSYGSQVWIRRASPFKVRSFVAWTPRIIEVCGSLKGATWCVVSAHAQCEGAIDEAKNNFWDIIFRIVSKAAVA